MGRGQQEHTGTAFEPPPEEVRPAYQPVELLVGDEPYDGWQIGRINGWWDAPDGRSWCRVRAVRGGAGPQWVPFDPDRIVLLPSSGT
ncbi:hypothetical protein [Kitasatospora sp. NPDC002040]|uniref:hypothetical protein n=1 Tax=Kitasatospora sp. NPDC002040 TaxID=3154661 RepID=UPI003321C3A5